MCGIILCMSTIKQKRAAQGVADMVRLGSPVKSMGKVLLEADYSHSVSLCPAKVTRSKGFLEEIKEENIVEEIRKARRMAMLRMEKTVGAAGYGEVRQAVTELTRTLQLLEGKSTENVAFKVI